MREYSVASLGIFVLALGFAAVRGPWRERALWLGFIVFGVMTVVADVVLTGVGIYGYDRRFNAGVYIGMMPLEDLGYGLALYLVAVTAWCWRGGPHD